MIKKIILLLLASVLSLASCKKGTPEKAAPTQMQNVIAIHDEVMPKMNTINSLVSRLKTASDSLQNDAYTNAIIELEASHKSMMDWMGGFSTRFNSGEILKGQELSEEKQRWLDEEEEKVIALKNQINESIKKAESLLKE